VTVASQRLDSAFAARADPTGRAILARLASGKASVAELPGPFAISQPAISKRLKAAGTVGPDFVRSQRAEAAVPARSPGCSQRLLVGWMTTAGSGRAGSGGLTHVFDA